MATEAEWDGAWAEINALDRASRRRANLITGGALVAILALSVIAFSCSSEPGLSWLLTPLPLLAQWWLLERETRWWMQENQRLRACERQIFLQLRDS